jgi:tRNA dimethylallyltransferase
MIAGIICGATGVGKSEIALKLAETNGFEVISADSRQIYQGLEVGTCQVSQSWRGKIPHHFMGFLDPSKSYSAHQYQQEVNLFLQSAGQKKFLVVGGTGMYIKALIYPQKQSRKAVPIKIKETVAEKLKKGDSQEAYKELKKLDPEVAKKIHPHDRYRIAKALENHLVTGRTYRDFSAGREKSRIFRDVPIICITRERESLYKIINSRVIKMIENGWIDEVKELLERYSSTDIACFNSLGYGEVVDYLTGKFTKTEMIEKIRQFTRNYAKRQVTYFRHQFPEASLWDHDELLRSLESCQWIWDRFKK